MKKLITILSLLCVLQLTACAQWYLFPGKKKKVETEKKEVPVEVAPVTGVRDSTAVEVPEGGQEASDDSWFYDAPSVINVSLILPLKSASGSPSSNFVEMYSGALLALRDLGSDGTRISLRMIDSSAEDFAEGDALAESDVVIGPVGYDDVVRALPLCGSGMLVSPLEPRTAALAEQGDNVIQSPVPWTRQIDELLDWLQEDLQFSDEVIVLREAAATRTGEQSTYLLSRLQERGVKYKSLQSIDELKGEGGFRTLGLQGKYRVLIASDSDSFISSSVKRTGIAAALHGNIVLYSTSKVRNCVGPDVLDLYNAETRLTAAYHIDYDSQAVKDFVLSYRALYGGEPGSFAFQGYDTVHYFVRMCKEYGRKWHKRLPDSRERGLQSDFRFDGESGGGRVNQAVRRVIYGKDLSMSLL